MSHARTCCTTTLERAESHLREVEFLEIYLMKGNLKEDFPLKIIKNSLKSSIKELKKSLLAIEAIEESSEDPTTDDRVSQYTRHTSFQGDYIWTIAKTCVGLTALYKSFFILRKEESIKSRNHHSGQDHVQIDIVSSFGNEWIKVRQDTTKALIWAFTNAGYAGDSSDESEDDDGDDPTGILKHAHKYIAASKRHYHQYRQPKIRFVFSRLTRNEPKPILKLFGQLEALGITVQTSEDVPESRPIEEVVEQLITPKYGLFSETLNIDYSMLKALVSDVAHSMKDVNEYKRPWVRKQASQEKRDPLLPKHFWPACGSRKLVTTAETVAAFNDIVAICGTKSERARAVLLFSQPEHNYPREERVEKFRALSSYEIPSEWQLPIEIVDAKATSMLHDATPNIKNIGSACGYDPRYDDDRTRLCNASSYLYGMKENITTFTCNRQLWTTLNTTCEENGDGAGPKIWLAPAYRCLTNSSEKQP